jgi:hypothetical protein
MRGATHQPGATGRRRSHPTRGSSAPPHLRGHGPAPYLVLDVGKFTACCRSCSWHSAPCSLLVEAQFAYGTHACQSAPVVALGTSGSRPASVRRFVDAASESLAQGRNGGEVEVLIDGQGRAAAL